MEFHDGGSRKDDHAYLGLFGRPKRFGKIKQVKKVFWSVFIVLAGFVLAQVVNPATAKQVIGIITGF